MSAPALFRRGLRASLSRVTVRKGTIVSFRTRRSKRHEWTYLGSPSDCELMSSQLLLLLLIGCVAVMPLRGTWSSSLESLISRRGIVIIYSSVSQLVGRDPF